MKKRQRNRSISTSAPSCVHVFVVKAGARNGDGACACEGHPPLPATRVL